MSQTLTVQEQQHSIWKKGTYLSAALCVILFTIFWNIEDPFWISISRFCAFIFFAFTILGYLKLMTGPLEITLNTEEDFLLLIYRKKDKKIQEEQFEQDTIKYIEISKSAGNPLLYYINPGAAAFKIYFTDTDRELYLFEFGGRPLIFAPDQQQKIAGYLKDVGIEVKSDI